MLISVRLRLQGELLDPDKVTSRLGVQPHLVRAKGEVTTTASGKAIAAKVGRWEWYSEDPTNTLSIDGHVLRLKSAFGPALSQLSRLPEVDNAWIDLNIVVVHPAGDTQVAFLMNPESMETLSKTGLPVEFSVYTLTQQDDSEIGISGG